MGSMTGVSNILGSTVTQYHGGCRHHCPRIYNVVHIHITYIYMNMKYLYIYIYNTSILFVLWSYLLNS